MSKNNVAVLGCFRSGTNFTKALLELNYDCRVTNNVYGWKHGLIPIVSNEATDRFNTSCDGVFFVTKNPFSFVNSLFDYYCSARLNIIAKDTFKEFIRGDIVIFDQAQPHSPRLKYKNPIELWNFMNWHYSNIHEIKHVRYEKLVENQEVVTSKLASKLGLVRTSSEFLSPKGKVKRMNDSQAFSQVQEFESGESFSTSKYLKAAYMERFDKDDIEFFNRTVDQELIDTLAYRDLYEALIG